MGYIILCCNYSTSVLINVLFVQCYAAYVVLLRVHSAVTPNTVDDVG